MTLDEYITDYRMVQRVAQDHGVGVVCLKISKHGDLSKARRMREVVVPLGEDENRYAAYPYEPSILGFDTNVAKTVSSITMEILQGGLVIVTASLEANGDSQNSEIECAIRQNGTSLDSNTTRGENESYKDATTPLAQVRGFSVAAGTVTFNHVCEENFGYVTVND